MEKQDIEILKILMEKAKERELGASSIIYYYALKHAIEELERIENLHNLARVQVSCK